MSGLTQCLRRRMQESQSPWLVGPPATDLIAESGSSRDVRQLYSREHTDKSSRCCFNAFLLSYRLSPLPTRHYFRKCSFALHSEVTVRGTV